MRQRWRRKLLLVLLEHYEATKELASSEVILEIERLQARWDTRKAKVFTNREHAAALRRRVVRACDGMTYEQYREYLDYRRLKHLSVKEWKEWKELGVIRPNGKPRSGRYGATRKERLAQESKTLPGIAPVRGYKGHRNDFELE